MVNITIGPTTWQCYTI